MIARLTERRPGFRGGLLAALTLAVMIGAADARIIQQPSIEAPPATLSTAADSHITFAILGTAPNYSSQPAAAPFQGRWRSSLTNRLYQNTLVLRLAHDIRQSAHSVNRREFLVFRSFRSALTPLHDRLELWNRASLWDRVSLQDRFALPLGLTCRGLDFPISLADIAAGRTVSGTACLRLDGTSNRWDNFELE
jgi:hypothetical protein